MKKLFEFFLNYKWTVMIVILILGGGGYYFYNKKTDDSAETKVKTAIVKKGDIEILVNGSGQIQAESQVDLKPQIAGDGLDVTGVFVTNNQKVKKGDLIATLDSKDGNENVRDAQLSLFSAEIQYKETAKEFDNKTEEETWKRNLAENTVQQRRNSLNNALEELEDYKITAPFDGIVTGLDVEVGDSISRDEILASVITEKMQAEISLNEIDAAKIKAGSSAILTFDVLGAEKIQGKVSKIDTIGQVASGVVSYGVIIEFEYSEEILKPGMSVEVDIEIEKASNILMIPSGAVQSGQRDGEYVWLENIGGESTRQKIETGITDDVYTEIKSGLKEGDVIVIQSSNAVAASSASETKSIMSTMSGGGPRDH